MTETVAPATAAQPGGTVPTFLNLIDGEWRPSVTGRTFLPEISRSLGPYVGLIITNCIIMGRAEAFAQSQPPLLSLWDGFTSGAGYMAVLLIVAFIRELLGMGTVFGFRVLPESFVPWTIMLMAPSAFFILGIVIWIAKSLPAAKERS